MNNTVDVAIIAYNQEDFITETMNSIVNQSYSNIQRIIVTDDGSTDSTQKIVEEYSLNHPKVVPVLAKTNRGIAFNVNRALKHVGADYLCIIGGDDPMHPDKIEKQVNCLVNNKDLAACAHDVNVFNTDSGEILGKFSDLISYKKVQGILNVKSLFDPSLFLNASSVMYRTEKIPENGFDLRLRYLNDFLFNVEVLMKGDMGFIDEVLGTYRIHGNNVTVSEDALKFGFEDALIAFSIIISKYPELRGVVKKRKEATYMDQILKSIKENDKKRAKTLSRVMISEGSYLKGISAYILSNLLNKKRVDNIYNNKGLLKFVLKFV